MLKKKKHVDNKHQCFPLQRPQRPALFSVKMATGCHGNETGVVSNAARAPGWIVNLDGRFQSAVSMHYTTAVQSAALSLWLRPIGIAQKFDRFHCMQPARVVLQPDTGACVVSVSLCLNRVRNNSVSQSRATVTETPLAAICFRW